MITLKKYDYDYAEKLFEDIGCFFRTGFVDSTAWGGIKSSDSIWGANDRINVGLVGCKNMGWANLADFLQHRMWIASLCVISTKMY